MDSKIVLTTGSRTYEVRPDTFRNWDEVICSYTRENFGGVVRKFTSEFKFIGETKDFLLAIYLAHGVAAKVVLTIYLKGNDWKYRKEFECPLDFSSIKWDDYTLSISSVDNSLSALIKASKGTKYEFIVGEDILPDYGFHFERIPMSESATYAFTDGDSESNSSAMTVHLNKGALPWLGNIGNETSVGGSILYKDDQDEEDGYIIQAHKATNVNFEWNLEIDNSRRSGAAVWLYAETIRAGNVINRIQMCKVGGTLDNYFGEYPNPGALISAHPETFDNVGSTALITGQIWECNYHGSYYRWENTYKPKDDYFRVAEHGERIIELHAGDRVRIVAEFDLLQANISNFRLYSSSFAFRWLSSGLPCDIDAFTPSTVATALLQKLSDGKVNVDVDFSSHDRRLGKTLILAAESIRAIPEAKLYSSFSEFTDWMEVVFGYVYWLEEREDCTSVHFVHRSELFAPPVTKNIENVNDLSYSVNSSVLYSTVVAGYEKKDYEDVNGREEFNFNNTYSTGLENCDKTLSLISKYRADSYGIEFGVQKRNADTTDTQHDNDVFFIYCRTDGAFAYADNLVAIDNALNNGVFNGVFNPVACVRANEGYIGMMCSDMTLRYTSSTGNSNVVVGGIPLNSDIELHEPLMTCGVIEFTTDDQVPPVNLNNAVKLISGGVEYEGYVEDFGIKYLRPEPVKYKLMVKSLREI